MAATDPYRTLVEPILRSLVEVVRHTPPQDMIAPPHQLRRLERIFLVEIFNNLGSSTCAINGLDPASNCFRSEPIPPECILHIMSIRLGTGKQ